jgi:hypothetical protein
MFKYIPYTKQEKVVERIDAFKDAKPITLQFDGEVYEAKNKQEALEKTIKNIFSGDEIDSDGNLVITSPIFPTNRAFTDLLRFVLKEDTRITFLEKFFAT